MSKPTLNYVSYFKEDCVLNYSGPIMECITKPLARSGRLHIPSDSEIIIFNRDPQVTGGALSARIAALNSEGEIGPTTAYFPGKAEAFLERTRQLYLDMLARGEDIFPIIEPTGDQIGPEAKVPFPSEEDKMALGWLLDTYLKANPDPHLKLAIVGGAKDYKSHTLETFLSIAGEFSEPIEIKPIDPSDERMAF